MAQAIPANSEFTFVVGELVLCYEPDPSKAKLLYDAKVIDVDSTKDAAGQVVPEYYVHFIGWNKSWDRWILECGILKDNEANRALQAKLVNKVVKRSSGKRQRQQQKERVEDDRSSESRSSISQSGSEILSENENVRNLPLVSISIPLPLKSRLEDDCYNIKRKKKLVSLPRKPTVREILEEYYSKCFSERERLRSSGNVSIHIVRDVVDGLLTCFDFMLSTLLLYSLEYGQYYSFFPSPNPHKPSSITTSKPFNTPTRGRPRVSREPVIFLEDIASPTVKAPLLGKEEAFQAMAEKSEAAPEGDSSARGRVLRSRRSTPSKVNDSASPLLTKRLRLNNSPVPQSPSSLDTGADSRDSEIFPGRIGGSAKGLHFSTCFPLPCQPGTSNRPSDIYGGEHLLRLFVKLPSILARMDMEDAKLRSLLDYVSGLLAYLADRSTDLFSQNCYIDFTM